MGVAVDSEQSQQPGRSQISFTLYYSEEHKQQSPSCQVSSWPMFRGEEVAATDTDRRRQVEEGSPEKGPTEGCSLSRLGAKSDPGRLSETLPPDIYMKNIDFYFKVL